MKKRKTEIKRISSCTADEENENKKKTNQTDF